MKAREGTARRTEHASSTTAASSQQRPVDTISAKDPPSSRSRLPDLLSIKPRPPVIGLTETTRPVDFHPVTKPFSLLPPPYTDADVPFPESYNPAYPHPLTAYASPGVNPATVRASGYAYVLDELLQSDPDKVKGSILASSDRDDVVVPSLAMHSSEGDGNGIPEKLWSQFESFGAARLPLGGAAASPFGKPVRAMVPALAPRFAQPPSLAIDAYMSATPSTPGTIIASGPQTPSVLVPDPSSGMKSADYLSQNNLRHTSSTNDLGSYANLTNQHHGMLRRHSEDVSPSFAYDVPLRRGKYFVPVRQRRPLQELGAAW